MSAKHDDRSMRYQRLLAVIDKALLESRNAFDANAAVKECYGDDALIFGDGDNMLVHVIHAMVDRVNDKVKEEMLQVLEKERVQEKLVVVEELISALDRADQEQAEADSLDRRSANEALERAKLPDGVLPFDVVSYRAYLIMKKERDDLLSELMKVETETKLMEQQLAQAESSVLRGIQSIEATGKELERTADVCSLVS